MTSWPFLLVSTAGAIGPGPWTPSPQLSPGGTRVLWVEASAPSGGGGPGGADQTPTLVVRDTISGDGVGRWPLAHAPNWGWLDEDGVLVWRYPEGDRGDLDAVGRLDVHTRVTSPLTCEGSRFWWSGAWYRMSSDCSVRHGAGAPWPRRATPSLYGPAGDVIGARRGGASSWTLWDVRQDPRPVAHVTAPGMAPFTQGRRLLSRESDGVHGWFVDEVDREADTLVSISLDDGRLEALWTSPAGAVTDLLADREGRPWAVAAWEEAQRWIALAPDAEADLAWLGEALGGAWTRTSRSEDDRRWVVGVWGATVRRWVLVDRDARMIRLIGDRTADGGPSSLWADDEHPWIDDGTYEAGGSRPVRSARIIARDGLSFTAQVTTPDPTRFGVGPWPTVMVVHGGPLGARNWGGFDNHAQRLADAGLAAVLVDFRGSSGHGMAFAAAWEGEFGDAMITDVADAQAWAVAEGIAAPDRIGWVGASYGGYAVLAAATYLDVPMRCAVSEIGTGTMIRHGLTTGLGYVHVDDRATRLSWSPDRFVDHLDARMLVIAGGRDLLVPTVQITPFVRRSREAGNDVAFALLPAMGHMDDAAGNAATYAMETAWLRDCLRDEPAVPPVEIMEAAGVQWPLGEPPEGWSTAPAAGASHAR